MSKYEVRLNNLNKTIKQAKKSALYARKLLGVKKLKSLKELKDLPFTTKEDLRGSYPFGGLCVNKDEIVEMHTTSGTTGKPTLSFYTKKDLEVGSSEVSKAWDGLGINKHSRVQFIMSYGLFRGAMLNTDALQQLGAFVLPAGIQPTARQVEMMIDFKIDTVVATPGFLLYLHEYLEQNKIPRSKLKLKRAIAAGEIYSNQIRKEIENRLNIKVLDHYGLCEVYTGIAYECNKKNGLHILKDFVIAEIVDPKTGKVLPNGEFGELVLTSLKKEASPIIRYRTGDISCLMVGVCSCGEKGVRLERIKNRADDLFFISGIMINPHELKETIFSYAGKRLFGGDMRIEVKSNSIKTSPKIYLTLKGENDGFIPKLKKKIKDETKVEFKIIRVSKNFFNRENNTKVKLVEYV